MKVLVFDTHPYDRQALQTANVRHSHALTFVETRLTAETAALANGYPAVCLFVNDQADASALRILHGGGVKLLALRSAGFNHVDLAAMARLGLVANRVPEYSPHAVAEHAVALLLSLNRKTHRGYHRVRDMNFSLNGLEGFDLYGKTVGILGTGKIGQAFARIMLGFGCRVLAHDVRPNAELTGLKNFTYVDLPTLWREADIISLHVPLLPATHHILNAETFALMKRGVFVLNTGRGALIDTSALIGALKTGRIGAAGLDVYEEEEGIFFEDHSEKVILDDKLIRLVTFPNVLITSHQAFLTREALANIAETTLAGITAFERGQPLPHPVR